MGEFQRVAIETEASQLADTALDKLAEELAAKGVVGYEPNEGELEVILVNVLAPMAANAAIISSVLLEAAFRSFGTKLLKLLYNEGAAATATTKWKLLEEGGKYPARSIPAGTQLEAAGLAFYTQSTTAVLEGEKEVTLTVIAAERGTEYNGINGILSLVNNLNYVSEVTIVGETSGGVNQETDEEYMNRLAAVLELQAPRPITAANFAQMALTIPSSILPSGVVVGRATAIDGYSPAAHTFEATPTSGSLVLKEVTSFTGVSAESTTLPQIHPGSQLKGVGIPEGTTVVSVNEGAKEITMSAKATSSPGKEKIEAIGSYANQRTVAVFVTNSAGLALTSEARTAIDTYLTERRELNFNVEVLSASYNEVQVTAEIHALPGYTAATIAANAKVALEKYLSPATYGNPTGATTHSTSWLNATQGYNLVRYNQLVGVLEAVQGVAYVPSGSAGLAIGLGEAPGAKTADLVLLGPAPLPETKAAAIKVTAV